MTATPHHHSHQRPGSGHCLDVAQHADGQGKALDLLYRGLRPRAGIIEVRFTGASDQEAMVQALELLAE